MNTCIPTTDTLVFSPTGKEIESIPDRRNYYRGQTPQSFSYPLILRAHEETQKLSATDDCQLVLDLGHSVHLIEGAESNIKITTELDLFYAEQLFFRIKQSPQASNSLDLKGKKIAITGGTGGIGQALYHLLLEEGALPLVISRSSKEFIADLSSFEQAKTVFERIKRTIGPLDGLVNCIGHLLVKELYDCSQEEIDKLIDTNLKGVIYCCGLASIKPSGHIVNISSSSYSRGRKGSAVYSATKAALVNFSQGFAEERPDLHVNVLAPQRTDTKMRQTYFPKEDPSTRLSPQEVASEIISLLKSQGITGALIDVRAKPQLTLNASC